MIKNIFNFGMLVLFIVFGNLLVINRVSAMEDEQTKNTIQARPNLCYYEPNANTCGRCYSNLRKNAEKREILDLSFGDTNLLSVCKECFDKDKNWKRKEQLEDKEERRGEKERGAEYLRDFRQNFRVINQNTRVPTMPSVQARRLNQINAILTPKPINN